MIEPYETLLGHMIDNPVMEQYLQEDVPDFSSIWVEAMPMLSSGEKIMVEIALALYNGHGTARVADIFQVDTSNQGRILDALELRIRGRI